MEVGAPACGIEFALGAIALTPRYEDLDAGIWARDPSLRRHLYCILPLPRVVVADQTRVSFRPVAEPGPGSLRAPRWWRRPRLRRLSPFGSLLLSTHSRARGTSAPVPSDEGEGVS